MVTDLTEEIYVGFWNHVREWRHLLFGDFRPVKTWRVWWYGNSIDEGQSYDSVHRTDLHHTESYKDLVSGVTAQEYEESPLDFVHGRYFYDAKRNETLLRIRGVKTIYTGTNEPYSKRFARTFVIPGRHEPASSRI